MKQLLIICSSITALVVAVGIFQSSTPPAGPGRDEKVVKEARAGLSGQNKGRIRTPILRASLDGNGFELLKEVFKPINVANGNYLKLREQLASRLRNDPAFVVLAVEYLKTEASPESARLLAQLIAENSGAAGLALLREATLDGLNNNSPERRAAALGILSDVSKIEPGGVGQELIGRVGSLAQTDTDQQVRLNAILTLQVWFHRDEGMKEQAARELVQTIISSTDNEAVRTRGYQALALEGVSLPAPILKSVSDTLQYESNPKNRALGISVLGMATEEAKPFALQQLEYFYLHEPDRERKINVATHMVTLGKTEALDRLKFISSDDPLLIEQMETYLTTTQPGTPQ